MTKLLSVNMKSEVLNHALFSESSVLAASLVLLAHGLQKF